MRGPARRGAARAAGRGTRLDLGLLVLLLLGHRLCDLRGEGGGARLRVLRTARSGLRSRSGSNGRSGAARRSAWAVGAQRRRARGVGAQACLARVVGDAAHERVAIRPAGGAFVEVLDHHSLVAGVAAVEDHHNLVGLRGSGQSKPIGSEPGRRHGGRGCAAGRRSPRNCARRNAARPWHAPRGASAVARRGRRGGSLRRQYPRVWRRSGGQAAAQARRGGSAP